MRAVIQRVLSASVSVDGVVVGAIEEPGLLVYLGVTHTDGPAEIASAVGYLRGIELPMRPRMLAALIGNIFEGAETEILAGVPEAESPHLEALEACALLIERAEKTSRKR